MTIPTFNVGGLASGLDTNSIVEQLVDLERIPIYQMESRQEIYENKDQAWQTINTRMSALHDAINDLDSAYDWSGFVTADSSNEDVATASASGSAPTGSVSFTVDQLATSHQMASTTDFTSASDLVGAGTLTLTIDGTDYTVDTDASTTLSDVASQLNSLETGTTASIISIDSSTVKLVVSSSETGVSQSFTMSGTQATLGSFNVVQQGADAQLTIGSGAGALVLSRSSNTVSDLMSGVTIELTSTSASPVTVNVSEDHDGVVEKVQKFVEELNSTLSTITGLTKYDADSGKAGALQGDSTARGMLFDLRSEVSGTVDGLTGPYTYMASVGVSIARDGSFSLDETKLREALSDDFDAVSNLFARSGTSTDSRVGFASATSATVNGTYDVVITQAASAASIVGSAYVAPGGDELFQITSGVNTIDVTVTAGSTVDQAVQAINDAITAAGITTLTASADGGAIAVNESRVGTAASFTIAANSFGLAGTFAGTDVAGTIDGSAATGVGSTLTADSGDAEGLALSVSVTQSQVDAAAGWLAAGSLTYSTGIMKHLDEVLDDLVGTGGTIDRARNRWQNQIDYVEDRIADMEIRLERRELTLRRQYTRLETIMGQLGSLSSQLTAAISGLQPPQNN